MWLKKWLKNSNKNIQKIPWQFQTQPGGTLPHCLPTFGNRKKKHHRQRPLVGTPRYFPGRNCPRCASILDGKFLPPWNFRPRVPGAWNFWKNIPCFQVPGPLVTKVWERYTKKCSHNNSAKNWNNNSYPPTLAMFWLDVPPAKRVATTFYFYGMG